jgi:hypothetical protein
MGDAVGTTDRPRHRVLTSAKTEADYFKPTADYYVKNADFNSSYHNLLESLYRLAGGEIQSEHYNYVLNPTNTQNAALTKYPAKLRNYDIIGPVINLLLGETIRRPNSPTVIAPNSYSASKFKKSKANYMAGVIAQDFVNNLNTLGIDTNVPTKPIDYQKESAKFDASYTDKIAIAGQEALDYLMHELEMDSKIVLLMYDWLVTHSMFTYKDVYMDNVDYEVCDPRDVVAFGVPENGYGEDAEAFVYRKEMTRSELLDYYNEELEEKRDPDGKKFADIIENRTFGGGTTYGPTVSNFNNTATEASWLNGSEAKAIVHIVCWQGQKKVGSLAYLDPLTGQIAYTDVDDTYKLDREAGDIEVTWEWVNAWYTTHVIDGDLYIRMGEGLVQRNELNNNSRNKLPFNCRYGSYRSNEIHSIVKIGFPFAILYNILHFRFEFALAKMRSNLIAFPFGLVPKKGGWDEDKWFYWASVHDYLLYDESAPNAAVAIQGIKELGSSATANYIKQMWDILGAVKNEWWDTIGVNRQRYGDTMASDGKAVTEQAVFRSALITEELYFKFDKFLESEYEGLIDNARVAWVNGKQAEYITSDGFKAYLNIEGTEFTNTSYGVFVSNSREEYDKLNTARGLLQTMGQNGLRPNGLLETLDAKNFSKMKELANRAVEAENELLRSQQEAQQKSAEYIQQMQSADKQRESEDKRYVAETQAGAMIEAARIRAGVDLQQLAVDTGQKMEELDNEFGDDYLSSLRDRADFIKDDLDERKLQLQSRALDEKVFSDATKLQIARENRNRFDKKV